MNLHGIVKGCVGAINPNLPLTITLSKGQYITQPDGTKVPAPSNQFCCIGQVQPLSSSDLQHLSGINITSASRAIYIEGDIEGVLRISQKGGDTIVMPDGSIWLTTQVIENWDLANGWCKVAATLQNGA